MESEKKIPYVYKYQQELYDILATVPLERRIFSSHVGHFAGNIDVVYQGRRQKLYSEFWIDSDGRIDISSMKTKRSIEQGTSEDIWLMEHQKARIGVAYFGRHFIAKELLTLSKDKTYGAYPFEQKIRFEHRILAENFPDDPSFKYVSFPSDVYNDGIYDNSTLRCKLGFVVNLDPP